MTIASEIQRIQTNIANAYDAAEAKGATMPVTENSSNLATTIASISGGGDTITATNTTGATVNEGDKVYIAANTNLKLINYGAFTSLGYTGIASETIANNASGIVAAYIQPPHSGLDQWDRVDNKATVVGFFTDGSGTKYAVCVADAQYRNVAAWWNQYVLSTDLPKYTSETDAKNATESSTFSMDYIRTNYNLSDFPAFDHAYSQTLEYQGVTYHGLIPNISELQMIYTNRELLDTLDVTLANYPLYDLVTWNFNNNTGDGKNKAWSATLYDNERAWSIKNDGGSEVSFFYMEENIIPIFEIPIP